jgi:hypothetical protein
VEKHPTYDGQRNHRTDAEEQRGCTAPPAPASMRRGEIFAYTPS